MWVLLLTSSHDECGVFFSYVSEVGSDGVVARHRCSMTELMWVWLDGGFGGRESWGAHELKYRWAESTDQSRCGASMGQEGGMARVGYACSRHDRLWPKKKNSTSAANQKSRLAQWARQGSLENAAMWTIDGASLLTQVSRELGSGLQAARLAPCGYVYTYRVQVWSSRDIFHVMSPRPY